jgi:hypothetical protein
MILSHPGQTRKYIKVEYVSQIEYDFQKSQVTGAWDHEVSVSAKSKKKLACVPFFVCQKQCSLPPPPPSAAQQVKRRLFCVPHNHNTNNYVIHLQLFYKNIDC